MNRLEILSVLATSLSLRQAARRLKIPHSTLARIVRKLEERGRFKALFNYAALGLVPSIIIAEWSPLPSRIIEGTVSIREGYSPGSRVLLIVSLTPYTLLDSYYIPRLKEMGVTPYVVIRGLEYIKWNPSTAPVTYIEQYQKLKKGYFNGIFIPIYAELEKRVFSENNPPRKLNYSQRAPDPYDLALIFNSWINSPWKPKRIPIHALKDGLKPIDAKRISDHWRKHLLPYWLYNTYTPFLDLSRIPLRVLVLSGKDSYGVARALASIPYTYSSFIDINKVAIILQAPCNLYVDLYKLLSTCDISVEHDLLLMPSLVKWDPRLWRFVRKRGKRWEWCEPKLIEVKARRRRV